MKLKSFYSLILFYTLLAACVSRKPIHNHTTANVPIEASIKLIEPYKTGMAEAMNEVIGFSSAFIEKKKPSSAIGSMMSDAVLASAQDHIPSEAKNSKSLTFSLLNYGGIRSTLDSGEITVGEIFQIMPFENEIVILKMESRYLDTLGTFIEAKGGDNYSFLPKATERISTGVKIREAIMEYVKQNNPLPLDYTIRQL